MLRFVVVVVGGGEGGKGCSKSDRRKLRLQSKAAMGHQTLVAGASLTAACLAGAALVAAFIIVTADDGGDTPQLRKSAVEE